MNKEEIKEILIKSGHFNELDFSSNIGNGNAVIEELSTLIQESNREVVEGFIKWQWEMGMCGVMDNSVVEEYLSSIGKEER